MVVSKRHTKLFLILSLIVGGGLMALAIINLEPATLLQTLLDFHPGKVAALLAMSLLVHLLAAWRWGSFLKFTGARLTKWRTFWYYLGGFSISFITPIAQLGGGPVKALIVNRLEKVPLRSGMVSAFLEVFLEVALDIMLIALVLPFLFIHLSLSRRTEWAIGISFAVVAAIFVFLYYEFRNGRGVLTRLIHIFKPGARHQKATGPLAESEKLFTDYFSRRNGGGWRGILLTLAIHLGRFTEFGLLFWLLGLPIDIFAIVAARIFMNIAYLVPIPGALGVSEWTQGVLFSTAFNLSSGVGVAFSIIFKAKDIIFTLVGLTALATLAAGPSFKNMGLDLKKLLNGET